MKTIVSFKCPRCGETLKIEVYINGIGNWDLSLNNILNHKAILGWQCSSCKDFFDMKVTQCTVNGKPVITTYAHGLLDD